MSNQPDALLRAADALFEAVRALRHAPGAVDELTDLSASSLRVLDEAATDAFYAHQEGCHEFHLESAEDHLRRMRSRADGMEEVGTDLTRHLDEAGACIERAAEDLDTVTAGTTDADVVELSSRVATLREMVALARPVAERVTHHAVGAAAAVTATDSLMLLDTQVHDLDRRMGGVGEGVSLMRAVMDGIESTARRSLGIADEISYAASHHLGQTAPTDGGREGPGIAI